MCKIGESGGSAQGEVQASIWQPLMASGASIGQAAAAAAAAATREGDGTLVATPADAHHAFRVGIGAGIAIGVLSVSVTAFWRRKGRNADAPISICSS